jgi:2-phospho-L-lactate guanylyltransferase
METGAVRVILPVKGLDQAKQRLASLLTAAERQQLVLAMLADVLAASRAAALTKITVLSPDRRVLAFAAQHGAESVHERPDAVSLNDALRDPLRLGDAVAALVILPDTPLVTGAELTMLLEAGAQLAADDPTERSLVMAPDRAGLGTNALLLRPPSVITPQFGPNSLARHRAAAERRGVPYRIVSLPGLALDLDAGPDLTAFLATNGNTHTHRLLAQLGLRDRLRDYRNVS